MSRERVLRTLEGFGLSCVESEVYVYLAKVGPCRVKDLSFGLRLTKQQLCNALNGLRKKGVVASRPEHDELFSAIAFEELLCLFMRINAEKAKLIEETKQEIVESWQEAINKKDKS